MNLFSANLKKQRIAKGMTQKQLADCLNRSESTVRMWELGRNEPDIDTLVSLCTFFSCSGDQLLGIDSVQNEKAGKLAVFSANAGSLDGEPIDYIEVPNRIQKEITSYIGLRCENDDMAPYYLNNDTVAIKLRSSCFSGQTALVRLKDKGFFLRRLIYCSGGFVLQPFSKAANADFVTTAQIEDGEAEIIGVAAELFRTM